MFKFNVYFFKKAYASTLAIKFELRCVVLPTTPVPALQLR